MGNEGSLRSTAVPPVSPKPQLNGWDSHAPFLPELSAIVNIIPSYTTSYHYTPPNLPAMEINLSRYRVVQYHHIDDYRGLRPLEEADEAWGWIESGAEAIRRRTKYLRIDLIELFRNAGWEGDGTIQCLFLPPAFFCTHQTHCEVIFHVKQQNNGTSFLAIPRDLALTLPDERY